MRLNFESVVVLGATSNQSPSSLFLIQTNYKHQRWTVFFFFFFFKKGNYFKLPFILFDKQFNLGRYYTPKSKYVVR